MRGVSLLYRVSEIAAGRICELMLIVRRWLGERLAERKTERKKKRRKERTIKIKIGIDDRILLYGGGHNNTRRRRLGPRGQVQKKKKNLNLLPDCSMV